MYLLEAAIPDDVGPSLSLHHGNAIHIGGLDKTEDLAYFPLDPLVPVAEQKGRNNIGHNQEYQRDVVEYLPRLDLNVLAAEHQTNAVRHVAHEHHKNHQQADFGSPRLLPVPKHRGVGDFVLQRVDEVIGVPLADRPLHLVGVLRFALDETALLHQVREIGSGMHLGQRSLRQVRVG